MMKTKPFNLDKALAGKPVIDTVYDKPAMLFNVFEYSNGTKDIYYMCNDIVISVDSRRTERLRMKCETKKIEGWVNVYESRFYGFYKTVDEAKQWDGCHCLGQHFISIEIEV